MLVGFSDRKDNIFYPNDERKQTFFCIFCTFVVKSSHPLVKCESRLGGIVIH